MKSSINTSMKATERPTELSDESALQLKGSGQLKFFGLTVYEAQLWADSGFSADQWSNQDQAAQGLTQNFALTLLYHRRLEGRLIAELSLSEMRKHAAYNNTMIDPAKAQRWLQDMVKAFPNVKAGDRLTGVYRAGHGHGASTCHFYYNAQPTAVIEDAQFARLFFGIWLHEKTTDPALRKQLLGLK